MDADQSTPEATQAAAEKFRSDYAAVRDQVARVVVGQREIVDGLLTCLFTGGHALLEGVPGIGKTLMVRTLASALSLDFGRVQFTPDLMPADITGTTVIDEVETEGGHVKRQFAFQRGPIFAQMVLADEINRATPKTQSCLLYTSNNYLKLASGMDLERARGLALHLARNGVPAMAIDEGRLGYGLYTALAVPSGQYRAMGPQRREHEDRVVRLLDQTPQELGGPYSPRGQLWIRFDG